MDFCRHVNPFRICTGLKIIGYFMIILVAGIVSMSYIAVIVIAWGPQIYHEGIFSSSSLLAALIVVVFHILLVLLIWSYTMVVYRDPGSVPVNWSSNMSEESVETGNSTTLSHNDAPGVVASAWSPVDRGGQDVKYCNRCQSYKPPRCHHCSICQRCVLKMDHHCVWVANCIGAHNYKFFLLFMFYTFLETSLDTFALLPRFIKFFGNARHSGSSVYLAITFLVFILSLAFALSLLCFLVMHSSLLLSNTTTIEVYEKNKSGRWKYDVGKRKNFEQVFGTKKLFWLFPMYSKEDMVNLPVLRGIEFPVHPESVDDDRQC